MSYVLGLDISTLHTGYVVLDAKANVQTQGVWEPPKKLDWLERGSFQAEALIELMNQFPCKYIALEGYSFASVGNKEAIITVGTIVRYFLRQLGYEWTTVTPSQVKKYAVAKTKKEIIKAVYKRWGFDTEDDNIADAYILARIALSMSGLCTVDMGEIKPQMEVIDKLSDTAAKNMAK